MLHFVGAIKRIFTEIFTLTATLSNLIRYKRKEKRLKTQSAQSRSLKHITHSKTYRIVSLEAACPSSFSKGHEGTTLSHARSIIGACGSITVEAAIVVPVMIFALYIMIFPLMVMESERRLQNTMETVAKTLTLAEYIKDAAANGLDLEESKEEAYNGVVSGLEEGVGLGTILLSADGKYLKNISFDEKTAVFPDDEDADEDMVYIKLDYSLNFPFSILRFADVNKSLVTNRRAWIGSEGGRGRDEWGDALDEDESDDEYVYVARNAENSMVYHTDTHCHYISNSFKNASVSDMDQIRNKYGKKYSACKSCGASESHGTVYYTESGTKYHSSTDCKANSYSFQKVKLSELEGYHECTHCAGKH